MRSGSVLQMWALATGKAREPMGVRRTAGTIRSSEVKDRNLVTRRHISHSDELLQILWYVAGQSTARQPYRLCSRGHVANVN